VFQERNLFPHLTVEQNLRLGDPGPIGNGLYACRLLNVPDRRIIVSNAPGAEFAAVVRPSDIAISRAIDLSRLVAGVERRRGADAAGHSTGVSHRYQ
jgi:hypothetical protein